MVHRSPSFSVPVFGITLSWTSRSNLSNTLGTVILFVSTTKSRTSYMPTSHPKCFCPLIRRLCVKNPSTPLSTIVRTYEFPSAHTGIFTSEAQRMQRLKNKGSLEIWSWWLWLFGDLCRFTRPWFKPSCLLCTLGWRS